jgi:Flp pilus assembly pilin Flp
VAPICQRLLHETLETRVSAADGLTKYNFGRGTTHMETIERLYARAEKFARGQTMTEYAMILATVAIVCLAAYQIMATDINGMLSNVDTLL